MSNKVMLVKAAEKFVKKCREGKAFSRETLRELPEALEETEIDGNYIR